MRMNKMSDQEAGPLTIEWYATVNEALCKRVAELQKSLSIADALVDGQVDAIAKLERRVAQSESIFKEILAVADEEEKRRLAEKERAIPDEVREAIDRLIFDAMLARQHVAAGMGYRPEEVTYPPHITIVQAWLQHYEMGEGKRGGRPKKQTA
jgi:hypothetical protein